MDTKQLETIAIDEQLFKEIVNITVEERVKSQVQLINNTLCFLHDSISSLLNQDWIKIKNKPAYYNHTVMGIFPDFSTFEIGSCTTYYTFDPKTFSSKFAGFKGQLIEEWELRAVFFDNFTKLNKRFGWNFRADCCYTISTTQAVRANSSAKCGFNGTDRIEAFHIPIFRLSNTSPDKASVWEVLFKWLKFDLIPDGLSEQVEQAYLTIQKLYKVNKEYYYLNDGRLCCKYTELLKDFTNQKIKPLDNTNLTVAAVADELRTKMPVKLPTDAAASIKDNLLNCDYIRCDLESYDEKILTDPNRGHWDLWEDGSAAASYTAQFNEVMMARNPSADINYDGVVGIDFGTKSTVVVYQKDSEYTMPMRIGTGRFSKKAESYHYENPTVMEFIDLDSFLANYNARTGRPQTSWEDLTTSHTAFNALLNSSSEEYYAYLYELKQWAGDSKRQIRLRDKRSKDVVLPPFLNIEAGQFDPIELYAYFIGLYINNMHNGIYLDYLMSFPVTYEKTVREKIAESFARGIKKSLPASLLSDTKVLEQFRVAAVTSEPAAYAICALREYGFSPQGSEKVFYSVFDFGGGTTDFDFGLFREAGSAERRYDYVVECFGAGGDQYLGGENLLELLAFEVFKANQDVLRAEGLTFILPPECKPFPGSEVLISDSQEARLNTTQLMEKLRPFWEQHSDYEDIFETGIIKVNLFDNNGDAKLNFELTVSIDDLRKTLRERIEKGVRNFFASLRLAFRLPATKDISLINIFLAGNSSKSSLVRELFDEYIEKITSDICGDDGKKQFFAIYPPLGSEETLEIQRNSCVDLSSTNLVKPTGKTGVAYGLIESRPGGRIRIIQRNQSEENEEIKFRYYIGFEKRKTFTCISDRELPYGEWTEFIDASVQDFTLYYTSLPEAYKNMLKIDQVNRKKCRINGCYPDAAVYYRAIKPTVIEYVVARPNELEQGVYLEPPVMLELPN